MEFEQIWTTRKPTRQEFLEHWLAALSAAGLISDRIEAEVKDRNLGGLNRILRKRKLARYEDNEAETRALLTELQELWTGEAARSHA
jgi:hypothetical protein